MQECGKKVNYRTNLKQLKYKRLYRKNLGNKGKVNLKYILIMTETFFIYI